MLAAGPIVIVAERLERIIRAIRSPRARAALTCAALPCWRVKEKDGSSLVKATKHTVTLGATAVNSRESSERGHPLALSSAPGLPRIVS